MSLAKQFIKDCSDRPGVGACVMEDAKGRKNELSKDSSIQGTRHGQRLARMAGLSFLDRALIGKEAKRAGSRFTIWQGSQE